MRPLRHALHACTLVAFGPLALGCSSTGDDNSTDSNSDSLLGLPLPGVINPLNCFIAQPKDTLIAELVKDSWRVNYPLTRLYVGSDGLITGPGLPPALAGELEVINTVEPARASVARALAGVSGLPDYGMGAMSFALPACILGVPAWTPNGTSTVYTTQNLVFPNGVNVSSWRTAHREFGKECPLVRSLLNTDVIDPPGDGSTNLPPSATVSATGVTANAYGLCAPGTAIGTYCKLNYATGVRWTGRNCQLYYGSTRCLVY
ncbi:MAG TPA: hypothetical protein VK524_31520 [Polyangiaceae bacterium]|nr:hypothetical protein [Polyangiaceae bacterium]